MSYTVEELQILMESFEKTRLTRFRYSTQDETLEFRNELQDDHCGCVPGGREEMTGALGKAVSEAKAVSGSTAFGKTASGAETAFGKSASAAGTALQKTEFGSGTGSAGSEKTAGEASGSAAGAFPGNGAVPEGESAEDTVAVRAPLAGIFYRAAGPGQKPYVEEGQSVKKGDIVGLVEAMKMMNEIPSPCDGIIREIRAEDAAFTGYDAVLMTIGEN